MNSCGVYIGSSIAAYGFGEGHPFGTDRHDAFKKRFLEKSLDQQTQLFDPSTCDEETIALFHDVEYIKKVQDLSKSGFGTFDQGDTPAFMGAWEASSAVAGTVIQSLDHIIEGRIEKSFIPIAGLHHARRHTAAGFCVINDIGVLIEVARQKYSINRIAYIDIDAHHGDGVFYEYEKDPDVWIVDLHQDGRTLYPGTGHRNETGLGQAEGTKLNFPFEPFSSEEAFHQSWPEAIRFIDRCKPELIILQSGADSIAGDPITSMQFSPSCFYEVAKSLAELANQHCKGRMISLGGGGYNRENLAEGWSQIVNGMLLNPKENK